MTNKELIDILHNIPQEVFQSKNHKDLNPVVYNNRLCVYTSKGYSVIEITLHTTMHYGIWYESNYYKDIVDQLKSYLGILGFTKKPPNLYSSARYTPEIGAVNSMMTDTEMIKLMQHEIANQMFDSLQNKE